ncbi:hypothetical protein OSB04_014012 [Centaurea solstitialis]|uniref:Reverse transcriptase Ty1/copia-type domain-containing protein n=1 Tax=Centaurea solstitialis TaxID=347529 RepID=A0AA38TLW2_9ASTR|nr:hypothetical protein OSB04_014012 [Centaurea solstitialis]
MKKIGYKQSDADHTLFVKNANKKITALIVYVDDLVVTGNDDYELKDLQSRLATKFELKDLGPLKYFLGIEVSRSMSRITMCQRKYILDLLAETGMLDCKPIDMLDILVGEAPKERGSGGSGPGGGVQGAAAPGGVQGAEPLAGKIRPRF